MNQTDTVFTELVELLRNFPGREYSGDINPDTLFFGDLGFASIDAVLLGEMIQERFNCEFPFHEALAALAKAGASDLPVGQLADFLRAHLQDASAGR